MDRIFKRLVTIKNPSATYCDGLTGLCIGLCQLEKDGFIEGAFNSVSRFHNLLSDSLNQNLSRNLDFLHGSIGISMFFLINKNNVGSVDIIEKVVRYLYTNAIPNESGGVFWKFPNREGDYLKIFRYLMEFQQFRSLYQELCQ